jgi:octanoyl-[GcvH]:protein N-octanoyltransferase
VDLVVLREPFEDPEVSYGLLQVVLEEVGEGGRRAAVLVFPSSRHVGVTRMDTRNPNFGRAVQAAAELGFPVLERRSGGGAVAANAGTLTLALFYPVEDLRHGIYDRYGEGTDVIVAALKQLGVDSEAGEVEAEFCPGTHSVRSGGFRGMKLAGLSQRVTRRAARLEALVMVEETGELVEVLERFYGALGLPFRCGSVGNLRRAGSAAGVAEVAEALAQEVRTRYRAVDVPLAAATLERARSHAGEYRVSPDEVWGGR